MIDPATLATLLEVAKIVGAAVGAGGAAWLGQRGKAKVAAGEAATLREAIERVEVKVDRLDDRLTRVEARDPGPDAVLHS